MKRKTSLSILITMLLSIINTKAFAFDIKVENADNVTIYYNFINDKTELEVTYLYNSYLGINPIGPYPSTYKGTVNIPEEVTYNDKTLKVTRIGDYAFVDCNDPFSVNIPNSVTTIGNSAFVGSRIASLSIPESVTSIGRNAFFQCLSLYSLSIPASLKKIDSQAFYGCSSLRKVIIKDLAAWCRISFSNEEANPLYSAKHLYMDEGTEITELVIPKEIPSISRFAFSHCSGLTSVTLSDGVSIIGDYAFEQCTGLTSLTIGNSVTSIGEEAFAGCTGLTSLVIGEFVTNIGNSAFASCTGLTSLTIGNQVENIGDNAFYKCSGLSSVTIPNRVRTIGNNAFRDCTGLTSLKIGDNVTNIGNSAFARCSGLTSVTMPNSVASIGDRAFQECTGLLYLFIPYSVNLIGDCAFKSCDNLVSVVSQIENPFAIPGKSMSSFRAFSEKACKYATLYVPYWTKEKYMATTGWNEFLFIQEGTDDVVPDTPNPQKCEKPNIGYDNGKLTFYCATEGATCRYTITDTDIRSGSGNEMQLTVTYHISAFATKQGDYNSDIETATLCWIDVVPKMEGINNGVASVKALPVLIQSKEGVLRITGALEGMPIYVYNMNGQMVGSAEGDADVTTVNTMLQNGDVGIVKIGKKTVKVLMK